MKRPNSLSVTYTVVERGTERPVIREQVRGCGESPSQKRHQPYEQLASDGSSLEMPLK